MFTVAVPALDEGTVPTKRNITTAAAVVHLRYARLVLSSNYLKILLQKLWQLQITWDEAIPAELLVTAAIPSEDGLTRVVNLHCKGETYRRATNKLWSCWCLMAQMPSSPGGGGGGGGCSGLYCLKETKIVDRQLLFDYRRSSSIISFCLLLFCFSVVFCDIIVLLFCVLTPVIFTRD